MDNPYVRRQMQCPLCGGFKTIGLVACWKCYRAFDLRNGNPKAEAHIAAAEAREVAASSGIAHLVPAHA